MSSDSDSSDSSDEPVLVTFKSKSCRKPTDAAGSDNELDSKRRKLSAATTLQIAALRPAPQPVADAVVDDTDGLDPDGEYNAWQIREMSRMERALATGQ